MKGPIPLSRLSPDRPTRVISCAAMITDYMRYNQVLLLPITSSCKTKCNYISGWLIAGLIIYHVDGDGNVRHSYITVHLCLKK